MSQPIIFYDLTNGLIGSDKRCWSPNLLKARITLNYKRIPYKTIWVEFADAQALCKQIGATPTTHYPDGTPRYTLPTIHDPNTGRIVSDSHDIARYLDEQYPELPLMAKGTEDAQGEFGKTAGALIGPEARTWCMHSCWDDLISSRNRGAMERLYSTMFPTPPVVDRSQPAPDAVFNDYLRVANALEEVRKTLNLSADVAFVDIIAMSILRWVQNALRNEEAFERLLSMDGGKSRMVYDKIKGYLDIDEGEAAVVVEE